jgi:hypothetical protein
MCMWRVHCVDITGTDGAQHKSAPHVFTIGDEDDEDVFNRVNDDEGVEYSHA